MAFAVIIPLGRVFAEDPVVDDEFVYVETLPQNSNKLTISSLMGKITLENPSDPESTEAYDTVKYGFSIFFPGFQEVYYSSFWADEGELSSVGVFPVFIKNQKQGTGRFEDFVRQYATTGKFYYIYYVTYQKDGEQVWKFGYKDDTKGSWFEFDLNKSPRSSVPKNATVSSKIFSMVDRSGKSTSKFEVSYDATGSTRLEWIKARVKAIGAKDDNKVHFEFYACDAYGFSTKDAGKEFVINADGTFIISFTNDNDNEDLYGFDDFWQQAKDCSIYVRCVIEDKDEKVVFRSKYYAIKQNPK